MTQVYQFLFVKGGPVMYFIVLGSVFALGLFLERLWALRREKVAPTGFRRRVRTLVRKGQLSEAEVLCQENNSALAVIIGGALRERNTPREWLKDAVDEVGRREVALMDRHIDLLGTIAAVEPLMGLLGTVIGLISAFQRVEALAGRGQGVNPGDLAAGIWVAMITTAAGLIVAIPSYVGYRYLQARVSTLVVDLEEDSMEFVHLLADDAPGRNGSAGASGSDVAKKDQGDSAAAGDPASEKVVAKRQDGANEADE